jgi:hypothetical protein
VGKTTADNMKAYMKRNIGGLFDLSLSGGPVTHNSVLRREHGADFLTLALVAELVSSVA